MPISEILRQEGFLAVLLLGIGIGFLLNMAYSARIRARGKAQIPAVQKSASPAGVVPPSQVNAPVVDAKVVAAITAAVNDYRINNA